MNYCILMFFLRLTEMKYPTYDEVELLIDFVYSKIQIGMRVPTIVGCCYFEIAKFAESREIIRPHKFTRGRDTTSIRIIGRFCTFEEGFKIFEMREILYSKGN